MEIEKLYKVCNFGLKAETRWLLKQTCQLPRVCFPAVALLHKKSPRRRKKICAKSFRLYSYFTQTSPSNNKNINYIFMYLRVFRCLSNSLIYNTTADFISQFSIAFVMKLMTLWDILFIFRHSVIQVCWMIS